MLLASAGRAADRPRGAELWLQLDRIRREDESMLVRLRRLDSPLDLLCRSAAIDEAGSELRRVALLGLLPGPPLERCISLP